MATLRGRNDLNSCHCCALTGHQAPHLQHLTKFLQQSFEERHRIAFRSKEKGTQYFAICLGHHCGPGCQPSLNLGLSLPPPKLTSLVRPNLPSFTHLCKRDYLGSSINEWTAKLKKALSFSPPFYSWHTRHHHDLD